MDLQILKVELPQAFFDPLSFRVELRKTSSKNGQIIAGYGEDRVESRAYEKAICELRERQVFVESDVAGRSTSNGIAAHWFKILAIKAAQSEMIERDAFLRHWLTKIPLTHVCPNISKKLNHLILTLNKKNHSVHFLRTFLGLRNTFVVVLENLATGGFVVGSSGMEHEMEGWEKAFREAYYNSSISTGLITYFNKKNQGLTIASEIDHFSSLIKNTKISDSKRPNSCFKELVPVVEVFAERGKMLRVFSNIITNASQAMKQRGTLTMRVLSSQEGGISSVHFVIHGTGPSIPIENLPKLFEAFFTSGKLGGTGLGLSIAHKIVSAHGGSIWCESGQAQGVEFHVVLPATHCTVKNLGIRSLPEHSCEVAARFCSLKPVENESVAVFMSLKKNSCLG